MASCRDNEGKLQECSSHLSAYIAVGIIIPIASLIIIAMTYLYLRLRQRQMRRQAQVTYRAAIAPIYNQEGHPIPYNYSHPPRYISFSEESSVKPPSYEQTVQQVSETNTPAVPTTTKDQQP